MFLEKMTPCAVYCVDLHFSLYEWSLNLIRTFFMRNFEQPFHLCCIYRFNHDLNWLTSIDIIFCSGRSVFINLFIIIYTIHKNILCIKISISIHSSANQITAGQLLCGGLFSADSLSNWFAAVAMLHAIQDNGTQKEQLLRVQLATSIGSPPVSLLQQCCNILAQVRPRLN